MKNIKQLKSLVRFSVGFILFASFEVAIANSENETARKASDKIKLKTLKIQGNKELPKVLFIVPWQDPHKKKSSNKQKLVLHSLYGDLFDPLKPSEFKIDIVNNISIDE